MQNNFSIDPDRLVFIGCMLCGIVAALVNIAQ
jgi:hypothetical protein